MNRYLHIHQRIKHLLFAMSAGVTSFALSTSIFANPVLDNVAHGNVTVQQTQHTTTVNQASQKAIINWKSFNIQNGERTHFNQPHGGVALNRINPNQGASKIWGQLSATGRIILVNPAGIYIGPNAFINVGSLIASTAGITDQNFLNGVYKFDQASTYNGAIINQGTIIAADHGLIALMGNAVSNEGLIEANLGQIVLASGQEFTMSFTGNDMISFTVDKEIVQRGVDADGQSLSDGVKNTGVLRANGGSIIVTAKAASDVLDNVINMQGYAQAQTVDQVNGEIILSADNTEENILNLNGVLDASGMNPGELGGNVTVSGYNILLNNAAVINVSGDAGAGNARIGGNYLGSGPTPNANRLVMAPGAKIYADALTNGNGGEVILWSNDYTQVYGAVSAKGGAVSGNGGFVETSGKNYLTVGETFTVNASASSGAGGKWLLDPKNLIVATSGGVAYTGNNLFNNNPTGTTTVTPASINAAGAGVTVDLQANTDVTITNAISRTNSGTISIRAGRSIIVNANIDSNDGFISLIANDLNLAQSANRDTGPGNITIGSGVTINSGTSSMNLTVQTDNLNTATAPFELGAITLAASATLFSDGLKTINTSGLGPTSTLSGTISGAGGLSLTNTGIIELFGANNYTGVTTLYNGIASINSNSSFGNASSAVIINSGGTIFYGGSSNITLSRSISLNSSGGTIDASGSGTFTISATSTISGTGSSPLAFIGGGIGVFSGSIGSTVGTFFKNGTGTWTLSNANSYTGLTTIRSGTLIATNVNALGTNSAGIDINPLTVSETTTLDLTALTSLANGSDISLGDLQFNTSPRLLLGNITLNDRDVSVNSSGSTISVNTSATAILGNNVIISGTGSLTKIGAGTLVISSTGTNSYSGATNINAGILSISKGNHLGTGAGGISFGGGTLRTTASLSLASAITLNSGGTISNTSGTLTLASTINGANTLTLSGAGTGIILNGIIGANTPITTLTSSLATTIGANISSSGNQTFNSAVTIGNTASLLATGGSINFANTINGANALTLNGSTGVTLSGIVGGTTALSSLAITGATAINGGGITTTGAQTYNSATTLGADTSLRSTTSGNISFSSTLQSTSIQRALDVYATDGTISFTGAVGGVNTAALASIKAWAPTATRNITFGSTSQLNGSGDTSIVAGGSILLANSMTNTGAGTINLRSDYTGSGTGTVTVTTGSVTATTGGVNIYYNPTTFGMQDTIYSGGTPATRYMLILNLGNSNDPATSRTLGALSNNSSLWGENFALAKNIDATATSTWNAGAGFSPIGYQTTHYSGKFDGLGNNISGLFINILNTLSISTSLDVGLFGFNTGTIKNLGVINSNITFNKGSTGDASGHSGIAGIVGTNDTSGIISNVYFTGTVSFGGTNSGVRHFDFGGVIGNNLGTVSNSWSNVIINGNNLLRSVTGGFAGFNSGGGNITGSYSSGSVTTTSSVVGGFVGENFSTIQNSYSTSSVSGNSTVGGFAGDQEGTIANAYSTGSVTGNSFVGGFAGFNSISITNSFWDTQTSGLATGIGSDSHPSGTTTLTGATFGSGAGQLANSATYSGATWNIGTDTTTNTWLIFNGSTRPMLASEYNSDNEFSYFTNKVVSAHALQLAGLSTTTLAASYTLGSDVNASGTYNAADVWGTTTSNSKPGFIPIGNSTNHFTGSIQGKYVVTDIYINQPSGTNVGLFGFVDSLGRVSTIGVSGVVNGLTNVGGLIGTNAGTVSNVYSIANVTGTSGSNIGGLVGSNTGTVSFAYSAGVVTGGSSTNVGGFAGNNSGTFASSYYDNQTSTQASAVGTGSSTGITSNVTSAMKTQATYTGWDFSNIWKIDAGLSYPYFNTSSFIPGYTSMFTVIISSSLTTGTSVNLLINGAVTQTVLSAAGGNVTFNIPLAMLGINAAAVAYVSGTPLSGNFIFSGTDTTGTYSGAGYVLANAVANVQTLLNGSLNNTSLATARGSISDSGLLYTASGNNLTVASGSSLAMSASSSAYGLNGNITASGSGTITFNNSILVTANSTLAAANSITVNAVNTNAADANTFAASANNVTVNGAIGSVSTPFSSVTLTGSSGIALNGGSVYSTGAGGQNYNGPMTIGADTILSSGTADINFSDQLNSSGSARSLTVNSTGTTTFVASIGLGLGFTSITTDAGGSTIFTGGASATTNGAGGQVYNDNLLLSGTGSFNAGTGPLTFNGTINQGTTANFAFNTSGTTTFNGVVGGTTALSSLTTDASGSTVFGATGTAVTTSGAQTYNDAVTITASTTTLTAGGNISLNGNITGATAGRNLTLTGTGASAKMFTVAGSTFSNIGTLTASGVSGTNTLAVTTNAVKNFNITGSDSGAITGLSGISTFNFSTFANLTGGAGADTFTLGASGAISGIIDGAGGSNTLNYTTYATAVNANLQTNTATGIGGTFSNIDTFVGSAASDTLTGANTVNSWAITGANAGTVGSTAFSSFENLAGGTLSNTYTIAAAITSITSNGSSGNPNTYNINSGANLTAITGSNFGDTFNLAGGSVTTVTGGSGNNILNYTGGTIGSINMNGTTTVNSTTVVTTGAQTYSSAVTLGAATTFTGSNFTAAAIDNGGFGLTVNTTGTSSISGVLSGIGGLTKAGSGTLTLNVANNYSGATNINAGILSINAAENLGSTSGIGFGGGTLRVTSSLTLAPNVSLISGSGTLDANGAGTILTVNGTISGANALTLSGTGDRIILNGGIGGTPISSLTSNIATTVGGNISSSGAQTFNNAVTISGANVTLNSSSGNGNIAFGSTVASNVSGTNSLTIQTGTGSFSASAAISGLNDFALISANTGSLSLSNITTSGSGSSISLTNAGNLTVNNLNAGSGTVALIATGSGSQVTTSGNITSTGGITYAGDSFNLGATLNIGSAAVTLATPQSSSTVEIGTNTATGGGVTRYSNSVLSNVVGNADTLIIAMSRPITIAGLLSFSGKDLYITTSGGNNVTINNPVGTVNNRLTHFEVTTPGAQTNLNTTIYATGNSVVFNDPVVLTGNSTIVDTGNVTFNSTINGGFGLSVDTTGGAIAFNGAIGDATPLSYLRARTQSAGQDITFGSTSEFNGAEDTAILSGRDINLADTMTGVGAIYLRADYTGTGVGTVTVATGNVSAGSVNIYYNPTVFGTPDIIYAGDTSATKYMLIHSLGAEMDTTTRTLASLSNNDAFWGENFALSKSINASDTANWHSGAGFSPIGTAAIPYSGSFDGLGYVISNLYINRPTTNEVGLFGRANSSIHNLGVVNGNITGQSSTGGLIGALGFTAFASVDNVFFTGTVTGASSVGGLIGAARAVNISNSYSIATVNGVNDVGGFIGGYYGSTNSTFNSYSGGTVNGETNVGGFVGNYGSDSGGIGGNYSYANVTGVTTVGGFVGLDNQDSTIDSSYSSGTVTGTTDVGGFAGFTVTGSIFNSFWDTDTSTQSNGFGAGSSDGLTSGCFTGACTNGGTANLSDSTTYSSAGWDIGADTANNTWLIMNGTTRPILGMEYNADNKYSYFTAGVSTAHALQLIGLDATTLAASYTLRYDIDASGTSNLADVWGTSTGNAKPGFVPIGSSANQFTGSIQGEYAVTDLYIYQPTGTDVGLFGYVGSSGSVSTIGVTGSVTGLNNVGGLIGTNDGTVTNVYSVADIIADNNATNVGGLIGLNNGSVSFAYAAGNITVGATNPTNIGGFIGDNNGTIASSHWDTEASGYASGVGNGSSTGLSGHTTAVSQQQATYAGWDFANIWNIDEGTSYPYFINSNAISGNFLTINVSTSYSAGTGVHLMVGGVDILTAFTISGGNVTFAVGLGVFNANSAGLVFISGDATGGNLLFTVPSGSGGVVNAGTLISNTVYVNQPAAADSFIASSIADARGTVSSDAGLLFSTSGNNIIVASGKHFVVDASVNYTLDGTNNITTSGGGNMTFAGATTVSGNATLTATGGTATLSTIDSNSAGTNSLTVNATNVVLGGSVGASASLDSISTTGATALNGTTYTTAGTQTYDGTVSLGNDITINASDVTFDDTVNSSVSNRALVVNASGATIFSNTVGDSLALASLTINAGGTTAVNGNVTTAAEQTYNNAVTLGADTVLTGTDIAATTLNNNAFNLTVNTTGTSNISDVLSGSGNLVKNGIGSLVLGGANLYTGSTTVNAGILSINAANNIDTTSGITLNGGTLRSTAGLTLTTGIALGASGGTLDANNGTLTVNGDITGSNALNLTGAGTGITLNSVISGIASLTSDIATRVNANISTSGSQSYSAATTIGGNVTLAATGAGNITLANVDSTATGINSLSITANTGAINLTGDIGSNVALNSFSAITTNNNVTVANDINTSGTSNSITLTAGGTGNTLTIGATAAVTGTAVNYRADHMTLTGSTNVTGAGDFSLRPVTNNLAIQVGATASDASALGLTTAELATINTSGKLVFGDTSTYTGNITVTGGLILAKGLNFSTNGGIVNLTSNLGSIGTPITSLIVNAGSINLGASIFANGNTIIFNAPIVLVADAAISDSGNITYNNTIDSDGSGPWSLSNTTSGGAVTYNGDIGANNALNNLSSNGSSGVVLNAAEISTVGTQDYTGVVTLNSDVNMTATDNDVTFNNNILGGSTPHTLSIATGTGDVNFNGTAGTTGNRLQTLTIANTGDTNINGGGVFTVAGQSYNNLVLTADTTFDSSAGSINLGGTVNGAFALAANGNTGVTFGDTVSVASVNVTGTTIMNAGTVTTTAGQTYNSSMTLGAVTTFNGANITTDAIDNNGNNLTINTTGTSSINGVVSDNGSLIKSGSGSLAMNATNTYGGTTSVNNGIVSVNAVNGLSSGNVTVASGATLQLSNTIANALNIQGTGTTGQGALVASGTGTANGAITLAGATTVSTLTGADTLILGTGGITGAQALTVTGSGTTQLNGNVSVSSVTSNSSTRIGATSVTTIGTQTYNNPVVLANNVTLSGVGITLNQVSTDGTPRALTVNSGAGALNLNGAIGTSVNRLSSFSATTNSGNIALANNIFANGNVSLTATAGSVTESTGSISGALLTVSATTGITLNAANTISSLNANSGAGNFALTNTGNLSITNLNAGANSVTLNNTGSITQTGMITAGDADFTAGANAILLTLNNAISGTVTFNNSGNNNVTLVNTTPTLALGTSNLGSGLFSLTNTGELEITGVLTTAGGDIDIETLSPDAFERNLTVSAAVNSNGGDISLESANNNGSNPGTALPLIINAVVNSSPGSGGTLTIIAGTVLNQAPVLGSGNIILDGNGIDLSLGTLTFPYSVNFVAPNNIIINGVIAATGGSGLSFTAGSGVGQGTTILGSINTTGDVTFTGNTILDGNIATSGGDVIFNDLVTLNNNVAITSSGTGINVITLADGVTGGANTLAINGTGTGSYQLNIGGPINTAGLDFTGGVGSTNNKLTLNTGANQIFDINSLDNGTVTGANITGPLNFNNVGNLTGGANNNTFILANGAPLSGTINGGSSPPSANTIDMTPYTTPIGVNLSTAYDGNIFNAPGGPNITNFANIGNILNNVANIPGSTVQLPSTPGNNLFLSSPGTGNINGTTFLNNFQLFTAGTPTDSVYFSTPSTYLGGNDANVGGLNMTFIDFDNFPILSFGSGGPTTSNPGSSTDTSTPDDLNNVIQSADKSQNGDDTTTGNNNVDNIVDEQNNITNNIIDNMLVGTGQACQSAPATPSTAIGTPEKKKKPSTNAATAVKLSDNQH